MTDRRAFLKIMLGGGLVLALLGCRREEEEEEEEVKYTCPMHPGVISDKPGSCPECGMDLVEVE